MMIIHNINYVKKVNNNIKIYSVIINKFLQKNNKIKTKQKME